MINNKQLNNNTTTDEVFGSAWRSLHKWQQVVLDAMTDVDPDLGTLLADLEKHASTEEQWKVCECLRNFIANS